MQSEGSRTLNWLDMGSHSEFTSTEDNFVQLAYSIDHVSLIGRAEPQHLYSLNDLFSNDTTEAKVRLCLQSSTGQKHLKDCTETFPMEHNGM